MVKIKSIEKSTGTFVAVGFIMALFWAALYAFAPSFITSLNYKITDQIRTGSSGQYSLPKNIVIIDLDEKSLAKYGQWPWPRDLLANLLKKIKAAGATSIALDMILAEPDRTSPDKLTPRKLQDQVDHYGGKQRTARSQNHDDYLAEELSQGPYVLGYKFSFKSDENSGLKKLDPLKLAFQNIESEDVGQVFEAYDVVNNLDIFSDAASFSGFLNAAPDKDGIFRRIPLIIRYRDHFFPSLSLAVLMQVEGVDEVSLASVITGALCMEVGDTKIPIDNHGNLLIDFSSHAEGFERVSAGDLMDDLFVKNNISGKIALVGSSASGLDHLYQTPAKTVSTHVAIHAHALATLLTKNFSVIDNRSFYTEVVASLLLAVVFGMLILRFGLVANGLFGLLMIICLGLGARLIFQQTGFLFSPLLPSLVLLNEYAVFSIIKTRKGQDQAEENADNALMLLKQSENNLNSIIGFIPDIVFRLDDSGKVTFVSPAIAKYGYSEAELKGRLIIDLVAPEDRNKATYRLNERRTGERATHDLELRLMLSKEEGDQGSRGYRYFSVSAQGIYEYNAPDRKGFIGTQGIVRDITEQKKLEERLLQAKKLEAVGSLAAGVAHDLNNILSGIVSYPDLILLDLPEDNPLRKKISVIKQSGQKAAAIVQDMVTLARRGVADKEVFYPNKVIMDYLGSPEFDKLKGKNALVAFDYDLSSDLLNVKGSPVHLAKAIMNIITNAFEAMPNGGNISVSSFNCYLDVPLQAYETIPEGEYVCLRVEDSGVGIAAQDLERIFEPFYTKKKMGGSGTGLGMTVIWATVKDQDGYIDLKSKEGEGTTIDIYLPSSRESLDEQTRRVVLEDYLGSETIMVVDDVLEQREIAVNMLGKLGYNVNAASSGEAALSYLKNNPVDLVVLDMIMPDGMDGLETYRNIIKMYPGQKAVIASGYSKSSRVKEAHRLGAGAYVQKPYTLEKIGVAIRTELDRK